jgi:hypothetical protein
MRTEEESMGHPEDSVASVRRERGRDRRIPSKPKEDLRSSEKGNRDDARPVRKQASMLRSNAKYAAEIWGELPEVILRSLKELSSRHALSIAAGDLQLLNGRWYVTHSGLLRMARLSRCSAITTAIDRMASDPANCRWVFRATVYKSPRSRGFVGYGDADPSNVSPLVQGAEMRVAETRAVNRALRKAYGIGLCSVEELGWAPRPSNNEISGGRGPHPSRRDGPDNGHQNGQSRLRDRLCLLIRQHGLDAKLVKAYAADYCGTATLRDAGRDLVEAFINNLAEWAAKDCEGLLCHLNSYVEPEEARK